MLLGRDLVNSFTFLLYSCTEFWPEGTIWRVLCFSARLCFSWILLCSDSQKHRCRKWKGAERRTVILLLVRKTAVNFHHPFERFSFRWFIYYHWRSSFFASHFNNCIIHAFILRFSLTKPREAVVWWAGIPILVSPASISIATQEKINCFESVSSKSWNVLPHSFWFKDHFQNLELITVQQKPQSFPH